MACRTLTLPLASIPSTSQRPSSSSSSSSSNFPARSGSNSSLALTPSLCLAQNPLALSSASRRFPSHVVRMAPEEEKMTRRSPLDFPIEWERPKPGRRPDIFPQFAPLKTPLPMPMPADPPEEDEEEVEKKEEEEEEEEEDPEKENPDNPEKQ